MNDKIYWTSRETNWDKDIWYEKSPGVCGSIWFPYAGQFMTKFPRIAVRTFWLLIKLKEAWNVFLIFYPNPYPDFFIKPLQAMKKVKYSGTIKVRPGDAMVYQQDGSVITLKEANKYSQIESGFCEECEARIKNAENMKCVQICETCARGLNKRTKIKVDNKPKMIAECKCRKQEIDIQRLVNRYGYIERFDWQCPVCWQTVNLYVKENNEEEV